MTSSSGQMDIRTPDQRLRVFVSSTMGELASERQAVSRAVAALRMTPVLFELGARPHPPQDVYRAYLEQSDIFIGLYWQRYGWIGPGMAISGLEDEFDLSAGLPRLLYIKAPAPDREPRLTALLDRIREEAASSYRTFATPAELGRLVRDDLATLLSERFASTRDVAPTTAPPGPAVPHRQRLLPVGATSLVGRDSDVRDVAELLDQAGTRLVTLTGPGGVGKTRLAMAVAERLADRYGEDMAFVALAPVSDPALVLEAIARSVGADLGGAEAPLEVLAEGFGDDRVLLILDNFEHVVGAATDVGELLSRCPGIVVLATSRTALDLAAEREYPVSPLPVPGDAGTSGCDDVAGSPAAALFVDRARSVRPGFALSPDNAAAVAEICRRLEGLPLAIELAAARTRLLDPQDLLERLAASLDALGAGAVDLPERQRTLRATVGWSVGLLDDHERSLLETVAVFVDGWTVTAAAQVAALDEDRAFALSEALVRHSLVQLDAGAPGPRCSMLGTVRAFVAERLASRPDVEEVRRRHAEYYRALVERADRPLRGGTGQGTWLEVLQGEARNVADAVRWHVEHEPAQLPHLFRILWPFWHLRDRQAEARPWVEALEPLAGSLGVRTRAELEWTDLVTACEIGDDTGAMAARRRLTPLLEEVEDPLLAALCQMGLAWSSPIVGDFDGARREVELCLRHLRGLDEPFWTALAEYTAAALEMAAGRLDLAEAHLHEMRLLAERFDFDWLNAGYRMQMCAQAIAHGRLEEAREQLDEALEMSEALRTTRYMTVCLAAYAQLASATGAFEQAAVLAGAAEGFRRRAGMSTWPVHRRGEAELVDQVRHALGDRRFETVFAEGTKLSQREAVAAVRGFTR
ncbi:MAG: DUF4062 domain-containing protein [Acidobacteriota bacterium]|nr:DUF4062 domain-containing protein [Acidobacteriota bacterium]